MTYPDFREVDVIEEGIVQGDRAVRDEIHLSDVLHYARGKFGSKFQEELSERDYHRFHAGLSFEVGVLSRGILFNQQACYPEIWKQYTVVVDGIHMTLDAVEFTSKPIRVWECKYTHFGLKKHPSSAEFQPYHWQVKSYALGIYFERKVVPDVRYVFCYGNGDYVKLRQPIIRAWDVTYTLKDLKTNWDMIRGWRDEMLADPNYQRR